MPDINNDDSARPEVFEPGRDVLQNPTLPLPVDEAKAVRAQERFLPDGKSESPEREALYQNLENIGESGPRTASSDGGTQAGDEVGGETADMNPIGERTG